MQRILFEDQPIEGGIERVLCAGNNTIGVVFFLSPAFDPAVLWHLRDGVTLVDVLDQFAVDFFLGDALPFDDANVEFWVGDHFDQRGIAGEHGRPEKLAEWLQWRASERSDRLELLRLTRGDVSIELIFGDHSDYVDRVAIRAADFDGFALSEFFTRFHRDPAVRDDAVEVDLAFRECLRAPLAAG